MLVFFHCTSINVVMQRRQLPIVRVARRWQFLDKPERVWKQGSAVVLPGASAQELGLQLKGQGYQVGVLASCHRQCNARCCSSSSKYGHALQVFLNADGAMYAFKGLAGRFAPIGVHASMLGILAGVAWGSAAGYKGSVMAPQGGEFITASALRPASPLAQPPPGMLHNIADALATACSRELMQPMSFASLCNKKI